MSIHTRQRRTPAYRHRRTISRRHNRHYTHNCARHADRRRTPRLYPCTERAHCTRLGNISYRNTRQPARHTRPSIPLERVQDLLARHRTRRGTLPQRTRRTSELPPQRKPDRSRSGNDYIRRAGSLPHRQIRNPHREPHPVARLQAHRRIRRLYEFRGADAVPLRQ